MCFDIDSCHYLKLEISNFSCMNMNSNTILINHAQRLGITDSYTVQKAEAFLRVLNSKAAAKTISDTGRIVLCLDLAATNLGTGFDKVTAFKLAGLRKGLYQNNLNIVEKILNLDKPLTVSELCVQTSCTGAKDLAEDILSKYSKCDEKIKDINHPQYIAAAVFTSCRISGIKVDKSQFKAVSRLKVAQWNELIEEFKKFSDSLGLSAKTGLPKADRDVLDEYQVAENKEYSHQKKRQEEEKVEEYEVWRERILKEAATEILNNEIV